MTIRVGMHDAKTHFSRLVDRALAGEEVVVQRSGKPVARIVPVREGAPVSRSFGIWRGRVVIGEGFDELPEDIAAAFGVTDAPG